MPPFEKAVKQVRQASNAAIKAQDLDGIAATLAQDCHVTVGSGEALVGRDQILAAFKEQFAEDATLSFDRRPSTIKARRDGLLAYEEGGWTAFSAGAATASGRYAASWIRTGDDWFIQSELFVTLR